MAKPRQYEVYDKITGKLLVKGTARYCSEVLHVGGDTVRAIARGAYNSYRFLVEEQAQEQEPEKEPVPDKPGKALEDNTSLKDAATRWDAFCEPIRKKYGIPVYRTGDERMTKAIRG